MGAKTTVLLYLEFCDASGFFLFLLVLTTVPDTLGLNKCLSERMKDELD